VKLHLGKNVSLQAVLYSRFSQQQQQQVGAEVSVLMGKIVAHRDWWDDGVATSSC
jgi:hypothetical protein